jgi:transposase
VDRRKRRRNVIDAEGLLRALMAWARGERRVCSMVPSPEEEDRRRLCREREALVTERIRHTNRIMLAGQGILDFDPLRPKHRERLDELKTGDGRPLPPCLLAEIRRQLGRLDAVVSPRSKPSAMAWLASARWIGPRRAQRRELSPAVWRRRSPLQWLKEPTQRWRRKRGF